MNLTIQPKATRRQFCQFALAVGLFSGCLVADPLVCMATAADAKASTIKLVIDYGDGVEVHYKALAHKPNMTVLDALTAAQAHKHGLTFKHRGGGSFALLTKLNDVENEGGGTKAKNWLYQVNGKDADVSFGSKQIQAGDVVLWKFDVLQYNE